LGPGAPIFEKTGSTPIRLPISRGRCGTIDHDQTAMLAADGLEFA